MKQINKKIQFQYCGTQGGTLAKITSSTEQSAAKTYLNSVDSSGGGLFWIGLTDLSSEGNYKWEDGTSATYFDWYSGEIYFLHSCESIFTLLEYFFVMPINS